MNRYFLTTTFIAISRLFGALLVTGNTYLINNFFNEKILGEFAFFLSVITISSFFVNRGRSDFIVKFSNAFDFNDSKIFLRASLFKVFSGSFYVASVVFILVFYKIFTEFSNFDIMSLSILFFIGIFLYSIMQLVTEFYRGKFNYYVFVFFGIISTNLFLLIFLLSQSFLGFNLHPVKLLIMALIITILGLLFFYRLIGFGEGNKLGNNPDKNDIKLFFYSGMIYLLGENFAYLYGSFFYNYEFVGQYYIVVKISMIFTIIFSALNSYLEPQISSFFIKRDFRSIFSLYKSTKRYYFLVIFPMVTYFFFGKEINSYFSNDEYFIQLVFYSVLIIGIKYILASFLGPCEVILKMTDKLKAYTVIQFISFFFLLLISKHFISAYGLLGLVISISLYQILISFLSYLIYIRSYTK